MEKSGKILENYEVDLENIFITLVNTLLCVCYLAYLYIAEILWSKFLYHINVARDDIDPSLLPAPLEV